MASRRKGRILAFQALYFWEASIAEGDNKITSLRSSTEGRPSNCVPVEELLKFDWVEEEKLSRFDESMIAFSGNLISGTIENINEIDNKIKEHLENWDISRLNRVDLAVLRMSVYSLMFQSDLHPSIIIDEAIGICREFGAEDSFKFINGVLDSIHKTLQHKETSA